MRELTVQDSKKLIAPVLAILTSCTALGLPGCQSKFKSHIDDRKTIDKELDSEVSLKADRSELDELRKEVPETKRQTNDELALYLGMMKQGEEKPEILRNKFSSLMQKRRSNFRTKVQKLRSDYSAAETRRRDDFLAKQKGKRDLNTKLKRSAGKNKQFFADSERERNTFFAEQRSRRQAFEEEITAQSKDFESYMRERNNEFNEQYRLYSRDYMERKKQTTDLEKARAHVNDSGGSESSTPVELSPAKPLGTDD